MEEIREIHSQRKSVNKIEVQRNKMKRKKIKNEERNQNIGEKREERKSTFNKE